MSEINEQIFELNTLCKEVDEVYHHFARHYNMPDSAVWILYALRDDGKTYTQKDLCDLWSFSKQTVNSTLKKLEKAKIISFKAMPGNRKSKQVVLTRTGESFMRRSLDRALVAEQAALESLSEKERKTFLCLFRKYTTSLGQEVKKIIEE